MYTAPGTAKQFKDWSSDAWDTHPSLVEEAPKYEENVVATVGGGGVLDTVLLGQGEGMTALGVP